ncbi:MAG TPA: alpha/beta hydrolase [Candidatus Saccharimonadales bacterium]|nr:alpha/beta hydrolase [Candidatus Saccharimonadales bacterium]
MPKAKSKSPADYIVPLNMNGLEGRMLRMPAPDTKQAKGREVMFVYGSHSSLERWWGVAQVLNRYGAVTAPDLPGFGGMESFYKLGKKPTLDNMADYLAAFIKLRYKRKKVMIVGMSYGFIVATRMLQRCPELTKKVTLMVSIVGFAHKDDFIFSKTQFFAYYWGTKLLTYRVPAALFRVMALNPRVLRAAYGRTPNAKHKYKLAKTEDEVRNIQDVEVGLWRDNDVRTWAYTINDFFKLDNCRARVNVPVWHVAVSDDHYFDHKLVEQHMRVIFSDFNTATFDMKAHAPSVLADEKDAAALFPPKLRRYLARAS